MAFTYNLETDGRYKQGKQQGIHEGIQKGMQKGINEGIQQGLQKGIHEGIQKGIRQGKTSNQLRVARESLKNGGSIEFTAKITGLSMKKVKEIKAELAAE